MLYIISSTLNTVLFGQVPPKPYQNHHLDPINCVNTQDLDRRKNPDLSGSETLLLTGLLSAQCLQILKHVHPSFFYIFCPAFQCPESGKREEKIEDINLLFIHMHHLINEFRPHQVPGV